MRFLTVLFFVCIISKQLNAQSNFEVSVPETYELSNIILALTDYAKTDAWEVQKNTNYYKQVLQYFDPVKDHPLLKKVNYSRALWEDYLSFRTDAVAYQFDKQGHVRRIKQFYANKVHQPFDENETLINDFISKSKFREFYKAHHKLYDSIASNYKGYYMLDTMRMFLEKETGIRAALSGKQKYEVILSPLVGRMNCHRTIDSATTADFPSLSIALIENNTKEINDQTERAIEIHTIFTELDHGFVNPITDLFANEVGKSFNNDSWDEKSGYKGVDCFNEYMTWALYDLFVKKYYLGIADSISTQWHYQNSSRGFFASNLFAKQLEVFYKSKKPTENLKDLYPRILNWISKNQSKNKKPVLVLPKNDSLYLLPKSNQMVLNFSTPIKKNFNKISCIVMKLNNGRATKERSTITITKKDIVKWNSDSSIVLQLNIHHDQFALIFNWWGCKYPVLSDANIMLSPQSYILLKHS